ncbi:hypothetical protein QFZ37_003065 [Chryseobacterium ginsenosidimutans]|uniref:hypothetical protein n=1 Tax=Chryseobacterium ginsenosidimutans TaxID=687846 RepID=UPI002787599E|nr:hypothetical protein [Chryseobacterium ginsenosidimutans]MDQ0594696.1 hypothetical protein [Chryseobacterium ginsenosidimutans]
MKTKRFLKIFGIVFFIFLIFRVINPEFSKKMVVLDCTKEYKITIFKREYDGFTDHNTKMDIAKCLCEKFLQTKEKKYESEIQKIINEFELQDSVKDKTIEDICNEREEIFFYWFYE